MGKSFNTYIFDLDGTLLNTLPDLVTLTNKALQQAGLPLRSEAEILSYVGAGVQRLLEQAIPAHSKESTFKEVSSYWYALYPECGTRLTREYQGITEVLKTLHQSNKLGVFSNKFEQGVIELVDEHFPGLFQVVHGESEVIPRKPDPKGLIVSMEELGTDAETTVYVGDSPNDIRTAQKAGVFSVGVVWGYGTEQQLVEAGADALVYKPEELLSLS